MFLDFIFELIFLFLIGSVPVTDQLATASASTNHINRSTNSSTVHSDSSASMDCRIKTGKSLPTFMFAENKSSDPTLDRYLEYTRFHCLKNMIEKTELNDTADGFIERNCAKLTSMTKDDCVRRVESCWKEAKKCCQKQIQKRNQTPSTMCPITWDDINCVGPARPNTVLNLSCPSFIPNFFGQNGQKRCMSNGQWEVTNATDGDVYEPSDYLGCNLFHIKNELTINNVRLHILFLSFICILAAISIFLAFKSLRSQPRIRIHVNLFFVLLLKTFFELFGVLLTLNRLYDPSIFEQTWCKWVYIMVRYFQNCSFSWMLCEALFLYHLLFRTFEQISNIKLYLGIGWGIPFVIIVKYVCIRYFVNPFNTMDTNCWVEELPKLEYLIRIPNFINLTLNVIFLILILRLIKNLSSQPSDRKRYWKRTFKAVLVLVPLFGLHLFLVIYHLSEDNPYYLLYKLFQYFVQDSQGVMVSLAFCAFNEEVLNILKKKALDRGCCNRHRPYHESRPSGGSRFGSTNSRSCPDHIPLTKRSSNSERLTIKNNTRVT